MAGLQIVFLFILSPFSIASQSSSSSLSIIVSDGSIKLGGLFLISYLLLSFFARHKTTSARSWTAKGIYISFCVNWMGNGDGDGDGMELNIGTR